MGLTHGPQPGKIENLLDKKTEEFLYDRYV